MSPKVQLLIYIDGQEDQWHDWLREMDLSAYSAIDVIYHKIDTSFLTRFSFLMAKPTYFVHLHEGTIEEALNYLVRKDCEYYMVVSEPNEDFPCNIPVVLKYGLFMIMDFNSSLLLISTRMHEMLGGWGEQGLPEKIDIFVANGDIKDAVYESVASYAGSTNSESISSNSSL